MILSAPSQRLESPAAWKRTVQQLRQLIRAYESGTRLPSIVMLAQRLGAGQTNTYRAVRHLVDEGLLESSPKRGTFVVGASRRKRTNSTASAATPRPNAGRRLQGKHVALFHAQEIPADSFILDIMDHCETALIGEAARTSHHSFPSHVNARPRFDQCDADALVIVNPSTSQPIVCRDGQVMAIISTASDLNIPMAGRYDLISVQEEQSSLVAGQHLRQSGAAEACFLAVHEKHRPGQMDLISRRRLAGFERGWGTALPLRQVLQCWSYNVEPGAALVKSYLALEPRPRAIFAVSDEVAVGFALGAVAHDLRAGVDYYLVGFDGQEIARNLASGPLTTLAVPRLEMGRCAADYLAQRILDPDRPVRFTEMGCQLLQGVSTPAPGSASETSTPLSPEAPQTFDKGSLR